MGLSVMQMGQEGGARAREEKNAKPPPDFQAIAREQAGMGAQANDAQTMANRPNQQNAFGFNSNWHRGQDGQWTQSQSMSGPLAGTAQSLMGATQANAGNMPQAGTFSMDPSAARDQAINAAYGQATSRLNPQWKQRENQLANTLANQGLDPSSQAYRTAMQQQGMERNDAYSSAMNGAIGQGTAAGSALFGQGLAQNAMNFGQQMQAQQLPYQQLAQLFGLGGQQGFNSAGRASAPDLLGAAMAQVGYDQNQMDRARQDRQDQYRAQNDMQDDIVGIFGKLLGGG